MIRIRADWQPAYMDSNPEMQQIDFETIDDAIQTINKWKKTACTVKVFEVEEKLIVTYVWGKEK
jgi:hypothetical protein